MKAIRTVDRRPGTGFGAGVLLLALGILLPAPYAGAKEGALHEPWDELLAACVVATPGGHSTAADYDCFAERRPALTAYLASLTAIAPATYEAWTRRERLAFLINAYNAWTVELILSAWPSLTSIRDLGSLLRSPWQRAFIPLLGATRSLDDIEHGMIRAPGAFDEPRIHFAVNCASIGCPALRREAYSGEKLDAQLEDQTVQFLGDRSRNRYDDGRLSVSPLFKWYREDFEHDWRDADSLETFMAHYAGALGMNDAQREALRSGQVRIRFLDYDWTLNAVSR